MPLSFEAMNGAFSNLQITEEQLAELFLGVDDVNAEVTISENNTVAPLVYAVRCHNLTAVNYLLTHHASVNDNTGNDSPALNEAAHLGDLTLYARLIESKARRNAWTSLYAALSANAKMKKLVIIESNAQTFIGSDLQNILKALAVTALQQLRRQLFPNIDRLDEDQKNQFKKAANQLFVENKTLSHLDHDWRNILIPNVIAGINTYFSPPYLFKEPFTEADAQQCITALATLNDPFVADATPAEIESICQNTTINSDQLKLFFSRDNVNLHFTATDGQQYTPLQRAVTADNDRVVRFLLELGAQPDGKVNGQIIGLTPLAIAARNNHVKRVTELVQKGADILLESEGLSPCMHALHTQHPDPECIYQLLLNIPSHFKVNDRLDTDNNTLLMEAVKLDDIALVRHIIYVLKADVNLVNQHGETALSMASKKQNKDIIDLIVVQKGETPPYSKKEDFVPSDESPEGPTIDSYDTQYSRLNTLRVTATEDFSSGTLKNKMTGLENKIKQKPFIEEQNADTTTQVTAWKKELKTLQLLKKSMTLFRTAADEIDRRVKDQRRINATWDASPVGKKELACLTLAITRAADMLEDSLKLVKEGLTAEEKINFEKNLKALATQSNELAGSGDPQLYSIGKGLLIAAATIAVLTGLFAIVGAVPGGVAILPIFATYCGFGLTSAIAAGTSLSAGAASALAGATVLAVPTTLFGIVGTAAFFRGRKTSVAAAVEQLTTYVEPLADNTKPTK